MGIAEPPMTTKTRIALIGLGMAVTPHAKSLLDLHDRVEVIHAFSRSEARRRQFAERFDFPLCDDLERVINDDTLNAVLILTPPNTHLELARRFTEAGQHILLEKPVERDTARAEQLVELTEQAGVKLGLVFQHRFRPAAERLRQLITAGALGELAIANVCIPWWRPQSYYDEPGRGTLERDGGGVLMTQAIHGLDLLLSLTGSVAEVASVAGTSKIHRMATEDFVGAGLRFANGALGALMATTAQYPGFAERIELSGTLASAVLEAGNLRVYYRDGREETVGEAQKTGGGADPMDFPHDAHRAVLTDFLDAVEHDRPPRVSGREALRVHYFIDALLRSGVEKRTISIF